MAYTDILDSINWRTVALIILAFIPYIDQETIGPIPVLRDWIPGIDPIYLTELSWTERGRLLILIVIPYVDGEILELIGVDVQEVIADS